jgi:hypothetical protein
MLAEIRLPYAALTSVRVGSAPQRSRTCISSHERLPTSSRNCRSPALRAKQPERMRAGADCGPEGRARRCHAADGQHPVSVTTGEPTQRGWDHDRRPLPSKATDLAFSRVFPGPQQTQFLAGRPGTDLAQYRSHGRPCCTHHIGSDQRKRWSACYLGSGRRAVPDGHLPNLTRPAATHLRYRVVNTVMDQPQAGSTGMTRPTRSGVPPAGSQPSGPNGSRRRRRV